MNSFSRTALLIGEDGLNKLRKAHVAVFGLGGVGGYAVEALARSGIGSLTLVDHDTISITNINRQILATRSTVGMDKAEVAKNRVLDIHPDIAVSARKVFYGPDTAKEFDFSQYDYIIDAIDTVTGKMALIRAAKAVGTPIISCMGTGNKLDPSQLQIADIAKTSVCPLARIMRKNCSKENIRHLKVLYSTEDPVIPDDNLISNEELPEGRRAIPGSVAFVPSVAGLMIAGEVIQDLLNTK